MLINPEKCLKRLQEGNRRFSSGAAEIAPVSSQRMSEAAVAQHPFAAIIACADSRCPVEQVFDQSWGDLFVVRVAGNVCSTEVTGSVEFALDKLGTPLLVVLGHTHCGAVEAASAGADFTGSLGRLLEQIQPAAAKAKSQNPSATPQELVSAAIEANVWLTMENLLVGSRIISSKVRQDECLLHGAILDIATGSVRWLGTHPLQAALMMH